MAKGKPKMEAPPAAPTINIRDRIKDFRRVPPAQLLVNEGNFRKHSDPQRELFRAIANEVGVAGALIAYETPEGIKLIDGQMRSEELAGMPLVPVLVTDLSEEEARKVLLTYDALGQLADIDVGMRADLVRDLESDHDALAEFLDGVNEALPDLRDIEEGMPGKAGDARRKISGNMVMVPVAVEDVALVERALRQTGLMNRGRALTTICQRYLDAEG